MTFWGMPSESFALSLAVLLTVAVLWLRSDESSTADESPSNASESASSAKAVSANRLACAMSGAALLAMLFAVRIAIHEYHPSSCGTGVRYAKEMMRLAILFGGPAMAFAWRIADPSGGRWTWTFVRRAACVFAGCFGFWVFMLGL